MGASGPIKTPKGKTIIAFYDKYLTRFSFIVIQKQADCAGLQPKVAESLRKNCYQISSSRFWWHLSNDICTGALQHPLTHLACDFLSCCPDKLWLLCSWSPSTSSGSQWRSCRWWRTWPSSGRSERASERRARRMTTRPSPISLTESFPHKLGRCDSQCAEMLLLHWRGFTLFVSLQVIQGSVDTIATDTHIAKKEIQS